VPTKAMNAPPQDRGWGFNGNMAAPTLSPSVRHYVPARKDDDGRDHPEVTTCHYFIQGGKIVFCPDCQHALSGQTVDLQPYESEAVS